jgi:hypothetical protein
VALAAVALAALFLPHPQFRTETVLSVLHSPVEAVAIDQVQDPELSHAIAVLPTQEARAARAGADGLDRIAAVDTLPEPETEPVPEIVPETEPVPEADDHEEPETPQERATEATRSDRAVAGELDAGEFTTIGVTFDDADVAAPVFLKVRDAHGWSDWYELHADPEEGPDPGVEGDGSVGTAPIWVRDADAYVVSLDPADAAKGANVVTVQQDERTVVGRSDDVGAVEGEQPLPGSPPVRPRSAWGARPPSSTIPLASSLRFAVVHHTVSSNTYAAAEVPGILRSIQAYHMDGRGWSDIGYNFLVDRYGGIWEGRGRALEGAAIGGHAAGFNTGSVGVSNIGNYDTVVPSDAQINATAEIIAWRFAAWRVDPNAALNVTAGAGSTRYAVGQTITIPPVVGHSDVGATSCPGAYLRDRLGQIRAQVAARVGRLSGPFGNVEQFELTGGRIRVAGWAIDPDTTTPVWILVDTAGGQFGLYADRRRDDVAAVFGGFGAERGFSADLPLPAGVTKVCLYGINQGPGADTPLGCKVVK